MKKSYFGFSAFYTFSYMALGVLMPLIGQYLDFIGFSGTRMNGYRGRDLCRHFRFYDMGKLLRRQRKQVQAHFFFVRGRGRNGDCPAADSYLCCVFIPVWNPVLFSGASHGFF